jgi:hypothetical protein
VRTGAGKAIVLLVHRPDPRQVAFYQSLAEEGYAVLVVVDDPAFKAPPSMDVSYVQVDERACLKAGYVFLNPMIAIRKQLPVAAWEKALFHVCRVARSYELVWFLEDDVFVPSIDVIVATDRDHPSADLLCQRNSVNLSGETRSWDWWSWVPPEVLPLPWGASMVCASRVSRRLLTAVDALISANAVRMMELHARAKQKQGPLRFLFIEFLFNTLAMRHAMRIETPVSLSTSLFHKRWQVEEMDLAHIYHPVKDRDAHIAWRKLLEERAR